MPIALFFAMVSAGTFLEALLVFLEWLVDELFGPILHPQALLQSKAALGFSAYDPRKILAPVMMIEHKLEWTALIPSLPNWNRADDRE